MLEARYLGLGLDHEAHVLGSKGVEFWNLSLLMYVVKKLLDYLVSSFQQLQQ